MDWAKKKAEEIIKRWFDNQNTLGDARDIIGNEMSLIEEIAKALQEIREQALDNAIEVCELHYRDSITMAEMVEEQPENFKVSIKNGKQVENTYERNIAEADEAECLAEAIHNLKERRE